MESISRLRELLAGAKGPEEALEIKKRWNAEELRPLYSAMAAAAGSDRRRIGAEINRIKSEGDVVFREAKAAMDRRREAESIPDLDLSVSNPDLERLSRNLLSEMRTELTELFHRLHFEVESGPEVVTAEDNFDRLGVPADHPSRSERETFHLGGGRILRTHCTVNSVVRLRSFGGAGPLRVATIGCVYRRDDETPRHTHQFTQLDFIWLDRGLTAAHLKHFLELILGAVFGPEVRHRLRSSHFPFTQPSVEVDLECGCGGRGSGCATCGGSGWVEVMGAGLLRREILDGAGRPEDEECLAGGFGLERLAMLKHGVRDIRWLYGGNFDLLANRYGDK